MDYTGLSPEAIHEIGLINSTSNFYTLLVFMLIFGMIAVVIEALVYIRKSKKYRQFLADMFVAGKIRQYAENDKINLDDENMNFMNWSKKKRNEMLSLDSSIEADLQDRITEDKLKIDKKTNKDSK